MNTVATHGPQVDPPVACSTRWRSPGSRRLQVATPVGIMATPAMALLLVPCIFWTGFTGNVMNLGGDDSHLMYLRPWDWLQHTSVYSLDTNMYGYNARSAFIPFQLVQVVIHDLRLNAEGVSFGLALSLTYLGMAHLTLELLRRRSVAAYCASALAGTVAVCAPLLAETQWTYVLTAIYWMPLAPWLLVATLRHQRTGHWRWIAVAAGALAFAGPAVLAIPYSISCGLCTAVVGCIAALVYGRPSIRRLAIFTTCVIAVNAFWIIPVAANGSEGEAQIASAVSDSGRIDAINVVTTLAPLMSAPDAIGLRNSRPLMTAFSHPQLGLDAWSARLAPIGWVPAGLAVAGLAAAFFTEARTRRLLLSMGAIACAALFLVMQTLAIVPHAAEAFVFLTQHVPGWTAERNFFDKFAIPAVESIALAAGIGAYHLFRLLRRRYILPLLVCGVGALVSYDAPFFGGDYFRLAYGAQLPAVNRVMDGLPADYQRLLADLQNRPPGAVLTLPLSRPAWSVVGGGQHGVYIGISPISYTTGRADYNGIDAFTAPAAPALHTLVSRALSSGDIDAFDRLARDVGVRYVVLNNQDDYATQYFQVGATDPVLEHAETARILAGLGTSVVASYGSYQLRTVENGGTSDIGLTKRAPMENGDAWLLQSYLGTRDQDPACAAEVSNVSRLSPVHLRVRLAPGAGSCYLVQSSAYSPGWHATFLAASSGQAVASEAAQSAHGGLADAYRVPSTDGPLLVDVIYEPQRWILWGTLVSLATLGLAAVPSGMRRAIRWRRSR